MALTARNLSRRVSKSVNKEMLSVVQAISKSAANVHRTSFSTTRKPDLDDVPEDADVAQEREREKELESQT